MPWSQYEPRSTQMWSPGLILPPVPTMLAQAASYGPKLTVRSGTTVRPSAERVGNSAIYHMLAYQIRALSRCELFKIDNRLECTSGASAADSAIHAKPPSLWRQGYLRRAV